MPRIKIEALKEGMVVAADVKNMDNMLLIPSGATLSEKQINILEAWGVTEILVENSRETESMVDPLSALGPERAAELTEQTKLRFWHLDQTDSVQSEIFRLILLRKARQCTPA